MRGLSFVLLLALFSFVALGWLASDRSHMRYELKEARLQLAAQNKEISNLNSEIVVVQAERDGYHHELGELRDQLAEANAIIEYLHQHIASLQDEHKQIVVALESELRALETRITILKQEIRAYEQQLELADRYTPSPQELDITETQAADLLRDTQKVVEAHEDMMKFGVIGGIGFGFLVLFLPVFIMRKIDADNSLSPDTQKPQTLQPLVLRPQKRSDRQYRRN